MTLMILHIRQLGCIPYREAWALQEELRVQRAAGAIPDTLLLCEHPPVFTIGKQDCRADWLATFDAIARAGIDVVQVNRGGRITYHGPGQLVGYFIVDLHARKIGIRDFVTSIETLLIQTLATFGVVASRDEKHPGVWVRCHPEPKAKDPASIAGSFGLRPQDDIRKIAAIGLHISRGITQHGFALNVAPNMEHYQYIIPCGITDRGVTTLATVLGKSVAMEEVMQVVIDYTASNVGASPLPSAAGSS